MPPFHRALQDDQREPGLPPRFETDPVLRSARTAVLCHLDGLGFDVHGSKLTLRGGEPSKDAIRAISEPAVADNVEAARTALESREPEFLARLAAGTQINPERIRPRLVLVDQKGSLDALLWRWAAIHWAVPTSLGYGRRLRYLVVDEGHNDALMGVIGLGDPVCAVAARDRWIGWDKARKDFHLTSVMEAFVLGAVPPYSGLIGGKLVAMLATSTQVRDDFDRKYAHKATQISGRDPNAQLLMVTTMSALGRSSIYNRLTNRGGDLNFEPLGYTTGTGDFHLSGPVFDLCKAIDVQYSDGVTAPGPARRLVDAGQSRRSVFNRVLPLLGFTSDLRQHGLARQLFAARTAHNSLGLLAGTDPGPVRWRTASPEAIGDWWLERWAIRRAARKPEFKTFQPADWQLYP